MSDYENAPATILLATRCAACARPLVDATSVEIGMGPDCRKQYAWFADTSEEGHEANQIVYKVALAASSGNAPDAADINRLVALGFDKLAARLVERTCKVRIAVSGDTLVVTTPYRDDPGYLAAWQAVPGRKWVKANKANHVPVTSKAALWDLLLKWFPGDLASGPKGTFTIVKAAL